MRKRESQRARLIAAEVVFVDEFEPLTQCAAVILDRPPKRRIRRVVDDDNALEIRVVDPGYRIERGLEHLGRPAMGGDVDRHFRCTTLHPCYGPRAEPSPPPAE